MAPEAMQFTSTNPERGWGRAKRDPEWTHVPTTAGMLTPGLIRHVRTGQRLRLTPRGWKAVRS